jgi:hypothetical protein
MEARTARRAFVTTTLAGALAVGVSACAVPPPSSPSPGGLGSGGPAGSPATTAVAAPTGPEFVGTPGQWGPLLNWADNPAAQPPTQPNPSGGLVSIHLAVSPTTGDVLMWDRIQGLTSARRWNPATNTFTNTPGIPLSLFCAFQVRLPDGTLAVAGGTAYKQGNTGIPVFQFFNWNTSQWTAGPNMHTPRWYPTMIELPDGRLVVMGGQVKAGQMANLTELYRPASNTWTELTGLAEPKPMGLYPRAILAPNGKIFVVKNASGQSAYMDVDTQTWTNITKAPPAVAGGGLVMYDTGKLLLLAIGSGQTESWTIDLNAATPVWKKVGSMHFGRRKFSTVLLPDGRVMAIGGSTDGSSVISKAVMTPEIWDPATGLWADLPSQGVPRMYHSNALLLSDGRVLSSGGGRAGAAPNFTSGQIYSPQYLAASSRPQIGAVSASWTGDATVNVPVTSSNGISSVVLMGLPGVTHGMDTSQRRMTLQVTSAFNGSSIGVRVPNAASLGNGYYYVIALDSQGVPSAAKIVQVTGAVAPAAAATLSAAEANVPQVVVDLTPIDDND